MAAGTSSLRCCDSGTQRAPSARVALERPEGAANSVSIRANQPVLTANPTDPGQGCSADTPRPLVTLLAGSGAPAHQVLRPQQGLRSALQPDLCTRGHPPRGSESPTADPGLDGAATPTILQAPCAPCYSGAHSRARAQPKTMLGSSAKPISPLNNRPSSGQYRGPAPGR